MVVNDKITIIYFQNMLDDNIVTHTSHAVSFLFRNAQICGNLHNTLIFHVRLTLTSVLLIKGLPLLESLFTSSHPSLNLLRHSKTHVHDIVLSPYTWWWMLLYLSRSFPQLDQKFQVYSFIIVHRWYNNPVILLSPIAHTAYPVPLFFRQTSYIVFGHSG